jgi:hypothetical protein
MPIAVVPGFASWGLRSPKTQDVHPQMAVETQSRRRQSGGSRRQAIHLHAFSAQPMEIDSARRMRSNALHEEFKWRIKTQTVLPGVVHLYLLAILITITVALFIEGINWRPSDGTAIRPATRSRFAA